MFYKKQCLGSETFPPSPTSQLWNLEKQFFLSDSQNKLTWICKLLHPNAKTENVQKWCPGSDLTLWELRTLKLSCCFIQDSWTWTWKHTFNFDPEWIKQMVFIKDWSHLEWLFFPSLWLQSSQGRFRIHYTNRKKFFRISTKIIFLSDSQDKLTCEFANFYIPIQKLRTYSAMGF